MVKLTCQSQLAGNLTSVVESASHIEYHYTKDPLNERSPYRKISFDITLALVKVVITLSKFFSKRNDRTARSTNNGSLVV